MNFPEFRHAIVYLTNDCNLSCHYCFIEKNKKRMTFSTGKAVIDFMLEQAPKENKVVIHFFGGEPLLEFNLLRKLIEYGKKRAQNCKKIIKFKITTNGTLFEREIINYFKKNNLDILFSFDGDKKRVVELKGSKAYQKAFWAIKELSKQGFRIPVRATVEPKDLRLVEFTRHIFSLGFDSIYYVPVAEEKWNQRKTEKAFLKLAQYFIKEASKGNLPRLNFLLKVLQIKCGLRKVLSAPCGVGGGLIGITVDGKIIPCQRPEVWIPDFILGNVFEKKINQKKRLPFLKFDRDDFINCNACPAKPYCVGSCLANSYYYNNKNMFKPIKGYCVWVKARVKAAQYIYNQLVRKKGSRMFVKKLNEIKVKA